MMIAPKSICALLASAFLLVSSPGIPRALAAPDRQQANQHCQRPRIALALGGGGVRGAAHIGVLKVFQQQGVPIDYIAGTSIGSIVGGLYAAGVPLSRIENMATSAALIHRFDPISIPMRVALLPITIIPRAVGIHPYVGLYRGTRFLKYLDSLLPPGRHNVEDTVIPFRAVSTDVLTGKAYVFQEGPLAKALQASSAIPWLRKPVQYEGRLLNDGFLADNVPAKEAREMGGDIVIGVSMAGQVKTVQAQDLRRIKKMENRTATLLMTKLDTPDCKSADIVLQPDVSDIPILSTKPADAEKAMLAGEKAAYDAMPQIRKLIRMENAQYAQSPAARPL